jgi:CheY-like chemotaxis protein
MKKRTIFIVDKNPIHRNLISYRLVSSGFPKVYSFNSIEECFYRMKKLQIPDFLIADYNSIVSVDNDFLRTVKSISSDIKVIFFTEADHHEVAENLLKEGATDYILKTSTLTAGISELIENLKYLCRESTLISEEF